MSEKTDELHLVWNAARNECVGFLDKGDADYAATGNRKFLAQRWCTPTLADDFRNNYGEDAERLPQITIPIPG